MSKNKKNKPLGIGLEALIPNYQTDYSSTNSIDHIDVSLIIPNSKQPRQIFSDQQMSDLIDSIRENGILQPLLVRPINDGKYELIAGERRLRSAKTLKIDKVPVYILDVKSDEEMLKLALIENIQRDNLSSIEEAEGYALLKGKYSFSESDLAKKIGKNRSTIANKLRLITLPPDIKDVLRSKDSDFTEGHARAVLSLRESQKIKNVFRRIKRDKLSVRDTEKLVKKLKSNKQPKKNLKREIINNYTNKENSLVEHLGTKVNIKKTKSNKVINIHFTDDDDLDRILDIITNGK
tara:strand:+ start:7289 stop:8167 length:879 start_codon:yes stop_codon:yes gene_type:complete